MDYSWFLVLFLIIWWLSGSYQDASSGSTGRRRALPARGRVSALALLRLDPAARARPRRGRDPARDPDLRHHLWLFGGVARMSGTRDSPGTEFKIAVAGPAVTLADRRRLRRASGSLASRRDDFWDAMRVEPTAPASPGCWRCSPGWPGINLLVLVFNLIPAFPLDGGRIARAIAWRRTGDRNRATRFAASLGQGFSYLLIGLGRAHRARHRATSVSGHLARAHRLHPRPVGARRRVADRVLEPDRGHQGRRRDGRRAGRDPGGRPASSGRSTSTSCATAGPGSRSSTRPTTSSACSTASAADDVPEPSRASQTVGEVFEPDATGTLRVRDDAPLEALLGNEPCAASAR